MTFKNEINVDKKTDAIESVINTITTLIENCVIKMDGTKKLYGPFYLKARNLLNQLQIDTEIVQLRVCFEHDSTGISFSDTMDDLPQLEDDKESELQQVYSEISTANYRKTLIKKICNDLQELSLAAQRIYNPIIMPEYEPQDYMAFVTELECKFWDRRAKLDKYAEYLRVRLRDIDQTSGSVRNKHHANKISDKIEKIVSVHIPEIDANINDLASKRKELTTNCESMDARARKFIAALDNYPNTKSSIPIPEPPTDKPAVTPDADDVNETSCEY